MMMALPLWVPEFSAWQADDWSAFGTCTTAGVAVVAAAVAWRQVREARRLREDQAQPYIAVYIETSAVSQHLVDLVIRNFGRTAAYDVRVSISPKLQRSSSQSGGEAEDVYVPEVLRTLVPAQEWRTFLDSGPSREDANLPTLYEAEVTFDSLKGKRRRTRHKLSYQLDYGTRRNTMFTVQYGIHDVAKALREIRKDVRSWTGQRSKGMSVYVRDGDARDQQQQEELEEARKQHEEMRHALHLAPSSEPDITGDSGDGEARPS